jgi:TonB family protein
MKNSNLLLFFVLFIAPHCFASRDAVYGDVLVSFVEGNEAPRWIRENNKQPKYPPAMAIANMKGCAVISFDVDNSGSIENLKVIKAIPTKKIGSEARLAIRKWKWVGLTKAGNTSVESKVVRIDYCIGGNTADESKSLCQQQSLRECR